MYKEEKIYTRRTINIGGEDHYFLSFKDAAGGIVEIEVELNVYEAIREFELIEARIARSDNRHIERFELSDNEIEARAAREPETTERKVHLMECLNEIESVINSMTPIQRRRFWLFRIKGQMLKEIAASEGISVPSVHRSVKYVERKIKKVYKNFSEDR